MGKIVEYFIVNKDLQMSPGKIAAQVAHAQTKIDEDVYHMLNRDKLDLYEEWRNENAMTKIVLGGHQKDLVKGIENEGYEVLDNGLTEIDPGSLTVVGFFPQDKDLAPKFIKRLQLL